MEEPLYVSLAHEGHSRYFVNGTKCVLPLEKDQAKQCFKAKWRGRRRESSQVLCAIDPIMPQYAEVSHNKYLELSTTLNRKTCENTQEEAVTESHVEEAFMRYDANCETAVAVDISEASRTVVAGVGIDIEQPKFSKLQVEQIPSNTPSDTPNTRLFSSQTSTNVWQFLSEEDPNMPMSRRKACPTSSISEASFLEKYGTNFNLAEYVKYTIANQQDKKDISVDLAIANIKNYGKWNPGLQKESGPAEVRAIQDVSISVTGVARMVDLGPGANELREAQRRNNGEKEEQKGDQRKRRKRKQKSYGENRTVPGRGSLQHTQQMKDVKAERRKHKECRRLRKKLLVEQRDSEISPKDGIGSSFSPLLKPQSKGDKAQPPGLDPSALQTPRKTPKLKALGRQEKAITSRDTLYKERSTVKGLYSPYFSTNIPDTALLKTSASQLNTEPSTTPSKRTPAGTSIIVPPPLHSSRFGLLQEEFKNDPYKLLVAVAFLQKTKGTQAIPVFREFCKKWPTPNALISFGTQEEVVEVFRVLGLQNQRAKSVFGLAKRFVENSPYNRPKGPEGWTVREGYRPKDPSGQNRRWGCIIGDVYGAGKYAIDSWRMFAMKPGEGGFLDGTEFGKRKRQPPVEDKTAEVAQKDVQLTIYPNEFAPGDEEWRRFYPEEDSILDKELRAYVKWMNAKDIAGFGTFGTCLPSS